MRPEIEAMAELMERRLDPRESWEKTSVSSRMNWLKIAVATLDMECPVEDIPKVAADVANFAMLYADAYGLQSPQYNPALVRP